MEERVEEDWVRGEEEGERGAKREEKAMNAPRWARTRITECCETLRLGVQRRNLKNGYCGRVSAVISHRKNRRCSVAVQAHVQPTGHTTTRGPTGAKPKERET
jgi:hypothetical protein